MMNRQSTRTLAEWLSFLQNGAELRDDDTNVWMQDISINAYKMPYEATPDRQDLVIREFANSVMTGCLEGLRNNQGSP